MTSFRLFASTLALLVLFGCSGAPTEPSDFEFGRADVYVRDDAGAAVNGATVRLEQLNGQVEDAGGLTGSVGLPGYYFFLKTSGSFRIVVTPPAGYTFQSGQTGTVPVTFSRNQGQTFDFVLRKV